MIARLLALETQLQQQREAAAAAVAAERQRREAAAAVSRRYALLWRHQSDRALLMCCLAAWRTEVTEAKEMRRKVCAMLCCAVAVSVLWLCYAMPPPLRHLSPCFACGLPALHQLAWVASHLRNRTVARAMARWTEFVSTRKQLRLMITRAASGKLAKGWRQWIAFTATQRELVA